MLQEMTPLSTEVELPGHQRDPSAEMVAGRDIGRVHTCPGCASTSVCAPAPSQKPSLLRSSSLPARLFQPARQSQVDPMHVVLGGEHRQRRQRVHLVAALGAGVGEARGHLVPPGAVEASPPGLFGECLKGRRDVAHVRRAAEHDGVGAVEDVPVRVGKRSTATTVTCAPASLRPRRRRRPTPPCGRIPSGRRWRQRVRRYENRCVTCYFDSIVLERFPGAL